MTVAPRITGFRLRLLIAMMLVVGAVTALALWITQRRVTGDVRQQLQQAYQEHNAALHRAWKTRHAALLERSLALARKPRIHAALEDDALDLLYPNAADELRDVMNAATNSPLQARFYRFLDAGGTVIPAPEGMDAGMLSAAEEAGLSLAALSDRQQVGCLVRGHEMDEVIAAPIISTDTHEVIASIVLGFKPFNPGPQAAEVKAGIWTHDRLFLPGVSAETAEKLAGVMRASPGGRDDEIIIDGMPHLVLSQLLNPGSMFPPAYEVCMYSFADAVERGERLRWRILSAGGILLACAAAASHLIAGRLAVPVEQLAVRSAQNAMRREAAEAALEQTSVELRRSMRFSADTSHQLKTPVTVLRAGLEELQQQPGITRGMREDISDLIFQTTRISNIIHDLLLLSRLDAGRMELQVAPIDLSRLIDSFVDDLSAVPNAPDFNVETDVPPDLHILGEKRHVSMILQNLLENAWKYNVPQGVISIRAKEAAGMIALSVGNSGPGIPAEAQEHVFERFHRAQVGGDVPGHGLGLNIARELALLHGGDLRLVRSGEGWTEFMVSFQIAPRSSTA